MNKYGDRSFQLWPSCEVISELMETKIILIFLDAISRVISTIVANAHKTENH